MDKKFLNDILEWDVTSWAQALQYWELAVPWNRIEHCLELGGRNGGVSLWLALKGKSVICSDLMNVEDQAEKLHQQYNLEKPITYQDIDASNIPFKNTFDIIVFKSIIGGIGRNNDLDKQKQVFNEIRKALKPGGILLFAENLSASRFHQHLRKKYTNWGQSWRYPSLYEMNDFLKDFSQVTIKTTGIMGTLGRNERQRKILAKIDQLILNKLCPKHWKYIAYGVAQK